MLLFPKLALGLSGFETGVALMPLVKGDPTDTEKQPQGRIANTHRLLTTAAVAGDNVGYATGHRFGRHLFNRKDSWLFHKDHLIKAQRFFERHGGKALVLARFMPVIRTFTPITAGLGAMLYPTFLGYNLVGGLLWTVSLTLLGFFLGSVIPHVDRYLLPIVAALVVVSVAPSALHLWRARPSQGRSPRRGPFKFKC